MHLNLAVGDADDGPQGRLVVQAVDSSIEPNSTISTWEIGALSTGDIVEIRILQDGEADPTKRSQSNGGITKESLFEY